MLGLSLIWQFKLDLGQIIGRINKKMGVHSASEGLEERHMGYIV